MKLKNKKGLQTFQTFGQKEIKWKSFAVKGKRQPASYFRNEDN